MEDVKQRRWAESPNDSYTLLRRHCGGIYASYRLFDGSVFQKFVHSQSVSQGISDAKWNHSSVFLLGDVDRDRFHEQLEAKSLVVELHDRDIIESSKNRRARYASWERIVRGQEEAPVGVKGDGEICADDNREVKGDKRKVKDAFEGWYRRPQDVFDVDDQFAESNMLLAMEASNRSTFGQCEIHLRALLDRSDEVANAFARTKLIEAKSAKGSGRGRAGARSGQRAKLTKAEESKFHASPATLEFEGFVRPRKRRKEPSGEEREKEWDFSEEERIVRRPGDYISSDTRLTLRAHLARPIFADLRPLDCPAPNLFERAVFVLPYHRPQLLHKIRTVHKIVNSSALPGVSLRSYQLSDEERSACESGKLDVMTGFQIVDDETRLVVVEGLADGCMKKLHEAVSHVDAFATTFPNENVGGSGASTKMRKKKKKIKKTKRKKSGASSSTATDPSSSSRVLMNARVRFTQRAYASFDVDLKMIRLRDPLRAMVTMADIYNRSKVTQSCFDTLHRMAEIRKCETVRYVKEKGLFPSVSGLLEVENNYGETVTIYDMEGLRPKKKTRSKATLAMHQMVEQARKQHGTGESDTKKKTFSLTPSTKTSTNRGILSATRAKLKKSLVVARKKIEHSKEPLDMTNKEYDAYLQRRMPKNFIKARNKAAARLRATVRKKREEEDEARRRDGGGEDVYIYGSQKLNSVTRQMDTLRHKIANDPMASYTFSKNFHSGTVAPVDPFEIWAQEKAESRKRWIVSQGFVYPAPKDKAEYSRHAKKPSAARIEELRTPWLERRDEGVPRGAPSFMDPLVRTAHGFNTTPIKGGNVFERDAAFWKSVHLCGEGLAKEQALAKTRALKEWQDKVVVDNVHFIPHCTSRRTNQIDRYRGLLKTEAQKKSLRKLRRLKSDRGVTKKLEPLPISAFNMDHYQDPGDFAKSLAKSDDANLMVGDVAFSACTSVRNGPLLPEIFKTASRRHIAPLSEVEKSGSLWRQST